MLRSLFAEGTPGKKMSRERSKASIEKKASGGIEKKSSAGVSSESLPRYKSNHLFAISTYLILICFFITGIT
jgi:hypothetical protein